MRFRIALALVGLSLIAFVLSTGVIAVPPGGRIAALVSAILVCAAIVVLRWRRRAPR